MDQGKKSEDYQLQAAWLAIGAAVLVMCWQCVSLGSVFERWRMWVFVVLNVLLLAILFTSTCTTTDDQSGCSTKKEHKGRREIEKRNKQRDEELEKVEGDEGEDKPSELSLTKEELNEKVEAFIAMFKQQLISDAKGRNLKQY